MFTDTIITYLLKNVNAVLRPKPYLLRHKVCIYTAWMGETEGIFWIRRNNVHTFLHYILL